MRTWTRREVLRSSACGLGGLVVGRAGGLLASAQELGERPRTAKDVTVLNPRGRVPVSLIIDDSTCLVNLAHYAIPQFAEVFPEQYKQNWRDLPREIPDAFVRKFGEWCAAKGVKGKYSIVPYPACVGWLDRDLPGWSKQELKSSLDLVRNLMMPNWDIHPEMVSHTWGIDTKTGRPYPDRTEANMENWGFSVGKSADFLTDYVAYALRVLANAGLRCEGVTTPGGFGSRSRPQLAQATLGACREVFGVEVPHYFRDVVTDESSVAPEVFLASGLDGPDPRCVVSVRGCTGDWFGDWDGLRPGSPDRFITEDGNGGRLPAVIAREEPTILVGHWPGFYFNGREVGFRILQEVVRRLEAHYNHLTWMKLSEIARYWAARTLTTIDRQNQAITLKAPFACPAFTLRFESRPLTSIQIETGGQTIPLRGGVKPLDLVAGSWYYDGTCCVACFDLPKENSRLVGTLAV